MPRTYLSPLAGRARWLVLALFAVLLLAPACDGDEDSDDAGTAPAATDAGGSETPADDEGRTDSAANGGSTQGSDAPSAGAAASDLTGAIQAVVQDARPSVVQITSQQALSDLQGGPGGGIPGGSGDSDTLVPAGVGSGVIIDDEGHIITNNHVIAEAQSVLVRLTDGREFEAEVVGTDPRTDLAVLRIEGDDLPVGALGDSESLEVGEWVVAIGNALGLVGGPTVTVGVVSAVGRTVQEPPTQSGAGTFLFDVIQTDAAINPGNSGGPLLNLDGEVIGINTLGAGGGDVPVQGISFAIAIDTALPLAEEMIETGTVTHPYLGITYAPLNPAIASQLGAPVNAGAVIREVVPGSPADEAGIEAGDIIVEIDGEPLEGESDLPAALDALDVGDDVDLVILREGEEIELTATLGEMPEETATPAGTPSTLP